MGERRQEGPITDPRTERMEETSRRQRRMEASSEGGQGPEGAVVTWMDGWMNEWMDGWKEVPLYHSSELELNLTLTVCNENCRRKYEFYFYPSSVTPTLHYNKIVYKIFKTRKYFIIQLMHLIYKLYTLVKNTLQV